MIPTRAGFQTASRSSMTMDSCEERRFGHHQAFFSLDTGFVMRPAAPLKSMRTRSVRDCPSMFRESYWGRCSGCRKPPVEIGLFH